MAFKSYLREYQTFLNKYFSATIPHLVAISSDKNASFKNNVEIK
jgi:hypothetical protein